MSLLNTKYQVVSVLANSSRDINKLKNVRISFLFFFVTTFSSQPQLFLLINIILQQVSELILERVEVLEKDGGRALGLHLLKFTQVIEHRKP